MSGRYLETHSTEVPNLLNKLCVTCRCSETRELYVLYSLALQPGRPAITSSVKCNAALEFRDGGKSSMLHVVEGDAGNLHDAFIELGKFFGLNSADTDLCDFLQALNVTQVGATLFILLGKESLTVYCFCCYSEQHLTDCFEVDPCDSAC